MKLARGITEIQDKMHFKILKTIYAFANTKGGDLYVGIENKKQSIEGIDSCDKKIVERILKQVLTKKIF